MRPCGAGARARQLPRPAGKRLNAVC